MSPTWLKYEEVHHDSYTRRSDIVTWHDQGILDHTSLDTLTSLYISEVDEHYTTDKQRFAMYHYETSVDYGKKLLDGMMVCFFSIQLEKWVIREVTDVCPNSWSPLILQELIQSNAYSISLSPLSQLSPCYFPLFFFLSSVQLYSTTSSTSAVQ